MKYVDLKYIRLASVYLQGFKDVGRDTFIFRCPLCGDSKKSVNKKRGYLYVTNDGAFFKCYNTCGSLGLHTFLKKLSPDLASQYAFENFGPQREKPELETDASKFKTTVEFTALKVKKPRRSGPLDVMLSTKDLGLGHRVREYVEGRKIPADVELYYARNLNDVCRSIEAYKERTFHEDYQALVFPFRDVDGTLNYLQARILFSESKRRYMTFQLNEDAPKFWGLDRVDFTKPVYLFEGPIDAMMVDNGIASAEGQLSASIKYLESVCQAGFVLVYDADFKTNPQIWNDLQKSQRHGCPIVIHDSDFGKFKDLNEAAQAGWSRERIQGYLKNHTFVGLNAQLKLAKIKSPVDPLKKAYGQQNKRS